MKRRIWSNWRTWAFAAALVAILGPAAIAVYIRHVTGNFGVVVEGKVYRSATPSDSELRRWVEDHDIRTVLLLQASDEEEPGLHGAAEDLDIQVVHVGLSARRLPNEKELKRIVQVLEEGDRPLLISCQGGSDRTGLVSLMAAMAVGGASYAEAKEELTLRHLHVGAPVTELLTHYEKDCAEQQTPPNDWAHLRLWLLERFRTGYFNVRYEVPENVEVEYMRTVRVPVRITNRSYQTIPLSDPDGEFILLAIYDSQRSGKGHRVGKRPLPKKDLPPREAMETSLDISMPHWEGAHLKARVIVDIWQRGHGRFSKKGSPVGESTVQVKPDAGYCDVTYDVPAKVRVPFNGSAKVPIAITNRSDRTIPFADEKRKFVLNARYKSKRSRNFLSVGKVRLAESNLAPGETMSITLEISMPRREGDGLKTEVKLDIWERYQKWFRDRGAEPGRFFVEVVGRKEDASPKDGSPPK